VYWNALSCEFVFDDITAIVDNKDLRPHVPLRNLLANDFWGTPMTKEQSHKSYRPLTVLTFRWNYWLGETDPLGYHLVNVLLHGLVTALFFKVCCEMLSSGGGGSSSNGAGGRSRGRSLVASVLFALHPVNPHRGCDGSSWPSRTFGLFGLFVSITCLPEGSAQKQQSHPLDLPDSQRGGDGRGHAVQRIGCNRDCRMRCI
jgi:hypothetical protein